MKSDSQGSEIVFDNVSFSIDAVPIVKHLSLRCTEQRIGIVGRNGSGKSTLARLLCGLLEPTQGAITIGGIDVMHNRASALRMVGILFQNPDHQIIFPTVIEEVSFGLRQLGESKAQAHEGALSILSDFSCAHWANRSVATLSQGQRHLVCLISIVAMRPKVIILDEPYAGLDIPTVAQLTRYINKLDAVVVHISHQAEVLERYDRVLWLERGEVVMDSHAIDTLPAYVNRMMEIGETDALL